MHTCLHADAEADLAASAPAKAGRRLWLHADIDSSPGGDYARRVASSRLLLRDDAFIASIWSSVLESSVTAFPAVHPLILWVLRHNTASTFPGMVNTGHHWLLSMAASSGPRKLDVTLCQAITLAVARPGAFGLFRTMFHEAADNLRLVMDNNAAA